MVRLAGFLVVAAAAVTGGCATNNDGGALWPDTAAYLQEATAFKVTPQQANQLALAENERRFASGQAAFAFFREPTAIVGNWYVFTRPNKAKIDWRECYYVNGMTGAVEYHKSPPVP